MGALIERGRVTLHEDGLGQLVFKTLQTSSDGTVVRWIETPAKGAGEPEHPAPLLRLEAASEGEAHGH